jgi:hypothetical protein
MKYIFLLVMSCVLLSCSSKLGGEISNEDFVIQVQPRTVTEVGTTEYKVRVFPKLIASQELSTKLQYQADSCFYLNNDGKRTYPDEVIPVATGVKNCFEFVLLFAGDTSSRANEIFIFNDKYLTGKIYQLSLK